MNEIEILVLVCVMTAVMWVPYILERIYRQGLFATVGYHDSSPAVAAWAQRAQKAHRNAVENLVLFAALLLAAVASDATSGITLLASQVYVFARIVHYLCYVLAVPWIRTLAFFAGFVAQITLAVSIVY